MCNSITSSNIAVVNWKVCWNCNAFSSSWTLRPKFSDNASSGLMLLLQELSITRHPFICLCLLHWGPVRIWVTYRFMLVGIQWKINPCRFGPLFKLLQERQSFSSDNFLLYGFFWRKTLCWMRFLNWWLLIVCKASLVVKLVVKCCMSFACGPSKLRACKLQGKNSKNIWFFDTWFFNSIEGSTNPNKFSVYNFNIATYRHMHG